MKKENNDYSLVACSCKKNNCLHFNELKVLLPEQPIVDEDDIDEYTYAYLGYDMFGVYCESDNSYSVIKSTPAQVKCLTCLSSVKTCKHVRSFYGHGGDKCEEFRTVSGGTIFESISTSTIPYRFEEPCDKETFSSYVKHEKKYPIELIPAFDETKKCSDHGNIYDKDSTVYMGQAQIHLQYSSTKVPIYYRPAVRCKCKQYYDGRSDLLLNVDNIHIFPYIWLLDILHNTQSNNFTLYGAITSVNYTRAVGSEDILTDHVYKKLRIAYNCFVRRLEFDYPSLYQCDKCGPNPKRVGMDDLVMGGRKDLLPDIHDSELPTVVVQGSKIDQQVFVRNEKVRHLLNQYAAVGSRPRYKQNVEPLSDEDFTNLCDSLASNPSLKSIVIAAGNPCPESLRKLIGELSTPSPLSGIIQIAGNNEVLDIITQAMTARGPSFETIITDNRELLLKSCPILIDFLEAQEISVNLKNDLIRDLLIKLTDALLVRTPGPECYGPINNSMAKLAAYPNNGLIRGLANYDADKTKDTNGCSKHPKRNSALNPGMFFIFCPHGICLGFQVMVNKESPRVPFEMLMTRFPVLPTEIIYDNGCNLHRYALKREPQRFAKTRFMVYRFHNKNHVACSLGYDMDEYQADPSIATFNSQVCEIANRDLCRLSTAFSAMGPENVIQHTKVFIAIRNWYKKL